MVLLSQQDAPGWLAFVDGRETAKLRGAGVFRAVFLKVGAHEVEWRYRPASLTLGAVISLLALAGISVFHVREARP